LPAMWMPVKKKSFASTSLGSLHSELPIIAKIDQRDKSIRILQK
jgi:hypothetical protein